MWVSSWISTHLHLLMSQWLLYRKYEKNFKCICWMQRPRKSTQAQTETLKTTTWQVLFGEGQKHVKERWRLYFNSVCKNMFRNLHYIEKRWRYFLKSTSQDKSSLEHFLAFYLWISQPLMLKCEHIPCF